jgi:archaellum biogenesis ATPase FlaH
MIKPTRGLKKTTIIWLSTSPGSEAIHPANTGILTDTIVRFLEKGKNTIILVDGFESIVTYTDFKKALTTLDHLKDLIVANDSRMIVTIDKRTLTEKEAALIEKRAVLIQG